LFRQSSIFAIFIKTKRIQSRLNIGIISLSSFNGIYHVWVEYENEVLDPSKKPKGLRMKHSPATEFFYIPMMNKSDRQEIQELNKRIANGD